MNNDECFEATTAKYKNSTKDNSGKHIPRFDFGTNIDSEGTQTATIKELLVELNYENIKDTNGKQLDFSSLKTVLKFLRAISGKPLKSSIEKHSIADIKTIKALFNYNLGSDAHLIGLIEPSGKKSEIIVDIIISPPTEDSKKILDIIKCIVSDLAKEIAPEELSKIDKICSSTWHHEMCIPKTNKAIDNVILKHIQTDEPLAKEADDYLADKNRKFRESIRLLKREPRIHIAAHSYFKLLFDIQWLNFQISTQLTIPNDRVVTNKEINFDKICRELSASHNSNILKDTLFLSINELPSFIAEYSSDIADLVSSSTKYEYEKRDVLTDEIRAKTVLRLYLDAVSLPSDINKNLIGIAHVIAAFCSIRHQRVIKSRPKNTSRKYSSTFVLLSPQNLLDQYYSHDTQDIPVTVKHIYTERTFWYLYALLGRKDKFDSHKAVHITQSELYRDIYMSLDPVQIKTQITKYRDFIVKAAHDFVVLHNKQDTILEWVHKY